MANYVNGNKFSGNGKGAIYNAGKNTKIIGNNFIDQDKGIINVGENMHAESNIFEKSGKTRPGNFWIKWWMVYIVYPLIVGFILLFLSKN
ncbi:hypothetical protein A2641_02440 [Candidatus Nomurabacteria bacterium RIFCSPHIGHO2_01_FULL_37_25]|uniref:Right handed beta helix domain-containing protein n=1 Tax=Candidatus Nomurabacteria bacterium RIFCSPLOWO2_01_FULL_36_16 TaxID=1801767 RepID=A0A1F6WZZ1_9BACT|nr:MAG: hypothetical protein A2641_02440 [Candidatus Nomurabacteria bacterium RIFCSPHIGHO2_01_FULL_37_25]OGI75930.1 MAG: hypothetical protein A3D36_01865 [Candidatus Nomurabacteria bacterium RIFCSPHIGHO2_02_FULL_36_29]OGI87461.1 MAG: hypothetical protein A3A91_02155 [Candidatus Nomurabacteria bacterium RIFCSPLOWO2_01_FULL_36_16]OGI95687.1 MAG: hypothetical protein A3I84_01085 [Candidatus Nomurabacteria bacterium RIFCSPLOWO2_02_FULL_36_8]